MSTISIYPYISILSVFPKVGRSKFLLNTSNWSNPLLVNMDFNV